MLADCLTKPLGPESFLRARKMLLNDPSDDGGAWRVVGRKAVGVTKGVMRLLRSGEDVSARTNGRTPKTPPAPIPSNKQRGSTKHTVVGAATRVESLGQDPGDFLEGSARVSVPAFFTFTTDGVATRADGVPARADGVRARADDALSPSLSLV
jgi:hypothetical protein